MTLGEIAGYIHLLERSSIGELGIATGTARLRLRRDGGDSQRVDAAPPAPERPALPTVQAPVAGVFRPVHPWLDDGPAPAGEAVEAGRIVGFLQAGPCLRPVVAPAAGMLGCALTPAGALVGFGTDLFELCPVRGQAVPHG